MKKLILITILFSYIYGFSQEEEVIEFVEETVIESTETSNVNQYYQPNTTDIVTGEIDNTLLIFKGNNSSLYGLKDKAGKMLVKPIFSSINSYGSTKDRIKASLSYGKEGVIDSKGNIIIPFEYSSINTNNRNVYIVRKDGKHLIYDYYGNKLLKKSYDDISSIDNYYKIKESGFYSMLDANGKEIFPVVYDEISYFSNEDWFLVKKNGVSSIIKSNGKNVFDKKYNSVSKLDYYFKYILVEKNGKFGIINKSGDNITPIIFEEIDKNYSDNFFIVKQQGKWGLYNIIFKKFLIEPSYDNIKMLSKNFYLVKNQNKKTLIDILSDKEIDFTAYDDVNNYISNNTIAIVKKDNLRGAVNVKSGKLIIPIKYSYIDVNSHYLKANLPDSRKSDLFSINGESMYKSVSFIKSLNNNYNYRKITTQGKMGLIYKGKKLIANEYDQIIDYKNSLFVLVINESKYGLISLIDGSFLIPLSSNKITIDDNKIINSNNKKYRISLNKLVEIK